jgi:hypothetical protein
VCYSKTMPPKWVMRLPSTNAAIQKFEPNWNQPSEVQKNVKLWNMLMEPSHAI